MRAVSRQLSAVSGPYRSNAYVRPAPARRRRYGRGVLASVIGIGLCVGYQAMASPRFTHCPGPGREAEMSARALTAVAEQWRANHGGECPTVARLKSEHELSASTDVSTFEIRCDGDATRVSRGRQP